jgi:hypothetical protein
MAKQPAAKKKSSKTAGADPRAARAKFTSAELPRKTLEDCLIVAKPIHEVYAGKSASWDELATAAGIGAATNNTKYLIWSAQAYDLLIKSGDSYALAETARKILAPTHPGERTEGIVKAVSTPTLASKFYAEYNGKLLPDDEFLGNVLEGRFQVPRDRVEEAKKILLSNAVFAGILTEHANGKRIIRLETAPRARDEAVSPAAEADISVSSVSDQRPNFQDGESGCFYITPIGEEGSEVRRHADMLLRHLVEPAFAEFKLKVVRADGIEKSGLITQQIFEQLVSSKFCVADLSFGNPNAFYELGIRHMTRLPTIQIIRKGDKIPFDVSQGRTISVDMSDIYTIMDKIESARRELVEHIRNYMEPGDKGRSEDNPVAVYLPTLQVRLPKAAE